MRALVELALSCITQLGLYALLALSLALVFGVSRIVNLAVGDLAAVGAYAMVATAGLPFGLRIVLTLVVLAPVLYLLERGLLGRIRDGLAGMLVTWGIGLAIRQVFEVVYTARPRSVTEPIAGSTTVLGSVYPTYRLVIAAVGLAVVVAVLVVAYRTRAGLRLRAVADNVEMAALMGTRPARTRALVFAVAGLLAVLAGALYSPLLGVTPAMGFSLLIPGFVAVLLARPASFRGAVLAVALVVALQVTLRRYFSDTVADSLFYVVVLVAVVVRANPHTRRLLSWSARPARPARSVPA
ncbi:branched-chain amino acid ABC transporter permease [Blastococcus haudaquaticus]|uniref:branched-chain amino acid ABC transporter permease n=1 Tax=Blastococcus haudaquaticus TaxID=1938745 RepID=UPI000BE27D4B|nr:branched-chain amino acid ABC transporter permease [Blastococcus haudaquaticus]